MIKTVGQKTKIRDSETAQPKIRESETKRNTRKQDFDTHSKHLRDFEIGTKISRTLNFPGTIRHPYGYLLLGNHFWAMSVCHTINKTTLLIIIFVKLHLNTSLPLSLKLTFSSRNCYQKFSQQMACLSPCPSGMEGEKVTVLPDGQIYLSWMIGRGFFRALLVNKTLLFTYFTEWNTITCLLILVYWPWDHCTKVYLLMNLILFHGILTVIISKCKGYMYVVLFIYLLVLCIIKYLQMLLRPRSSEFKIQCIKL